MDDEVFKRELNKYKVVRSEEYYNIKWKKKVSLTLCVTLSNRI